MEHHLIASPRPAFACAANTSIPALDHPLHAPFVQSPRPECSRTASAHSITARLPAPTWPLRSAPQAANPQYTFAQLRSAPIPPSTTSRPAHARGHLPSPPSSPQRRQRTRSPPPPSRVPSPPPPVPQVPVALVVAIERTRGAGCTPPSYTTRARRGSRETPAFVSVITPPVSPSRAGQHKEPE
jgi:hypothetical protein